MENTKAKTGKRIPIKEAKEIGIKNGYNQVIITAWDINTNTTSVCTWGKSMEDCDQAAEGGNFVKKALGWPEKLTNEKPSRVKKLERETTQLREDNDRLREVLNEVKKTISRCISIKDLWTYPNIKDSQFDDEAKALNSMLNKLKEAEQLLNSTSLDHP